MAGAKAAGRPFAPIAALVLLTGCLSLPASHHTGLFTSLPILWHETESVAGQLKADAPPHWAQDVLRAQGELRPLDRLADAGASPLAGLDTLVVAQPRALSPDENVALDAWVRGGGHLLLFADPMLTAQSAFAIGDRRRPEDVVMLSPILGHWGLRLEFDEEQAAGESEAEVLGVHVPVNLPGRLVREGKRRDCSLLSQGLAAQCRIGKGRVVILADAALLEHANDEDLQTRRTALQWLLAAARGE